MKMKLLSIAMLSSSLLLTACGGGGDGDTTYTPKPEVPENNIKDPVVGVPVAYTKTDFSAVATESSVLTYKMLGQNGKETMATSLLFVPGGPTPQGGWKIVAWAHGTTGVADQCAPSRNVTNPYIQSMITQLLAAGYVVVAPDYEGLGEPSGRELHPFLNVKSEAFSITDAVVAARYYLAGKGKVVSRQWMTVGHSQGGQAALGAAQYQSRAKLDYKGTIAVAPASNLAAILVNGNASVENAPLPQKIEMYAQLDTFTALITAGLRNLEPSFSYTNVFQSPTDGIANNAETDCFDVLGKKFGAAMQKYALSNGNLTNYPRTQTNFMAVPLVKTFLEKDSQPAQVKLNQPVTIYQGAQDTTVPKVATDALVALAQNKGSKIQYLTSAEWDHGTAYVLNIGNIVNDVKTAMPANN
ncbi:alpha/beta hydrolase family protein [Acinetobacter sp. 1000160]|uniref:alpha/beta hydrolase family protein n=1 Tax=Acinetobacter sp. 1000160 TaxID=1310800 RepID=UPI0004525740|nr:alpha/beta fold hydrolase [Acinetobacter sp. 1000160]EXB46778.1 prolyl oligopeptidase family protein [Acinetobacter baumannii 146457]EYT23797.1 prolyl oligopeptidase family protein [Acinetobacter sp. 1000160]